jgi:hypothetical protein
VILAGEQSVRSNHQNQVGVAVDLGLPVVEIAVAVLAGPQVRPPPLLRQTAYAPAQGQSVSPDR